MSQPEQHQDEQPGRESAMDPKPDFMPRFQGTGRLKGKNALISGGDSGIGRAVAVAFAREGANVAILYLNEHDDAQETIRHIEAEGVQGLAIAGDIGEEQVCIDAVRQTAERFGGLDILVNNAAEQHVVKDFTEIETAQIERTFRTNVFGYFMLTREALKRMSSGAVIVNTTSVTAYKGSSELIDYSATRGAIVAFTRSLSQALAEKGIRVNAVAPGPIWTPLIPASFDDERTASHGSSSPMGRAGQPYEVAACHLFLATDQSSYMTGQVLHPNGGTIVNA